ncbi:MAG TPA: hypothetical protein VE077_04850 [Candidatus Methylomirabilis sp.]|nr:hypothetical protein [Candidatus Methylomirabilis sp.]
MSKATFHGAIRWHHPKWGPQLEKFATQGSSIRRALNAALLNFFRDPRVRNVRNAAHAQLEIHVWRVKRLKGEPKK